MTEKSQHLNKQVQNIMVEQSHNSLDLVVVIEDTCLEILFEVGQRIPNI